VPPLGTELPLGMLFEELLPDIEPIIALMPPLVLLVLEEELVVEEVI
jgi:hypothetical protein